MTVWRTTSSRRSSQGLPHPTQSVSSCFRVIRKRAMFVSFCPLALNPLPDWPASCSRHWPTSTHKASHTAASLQKMCWSPRRYRFSQRLSLNHSQQLHLCHQPLLPSSPLPLPSSPSSAGYGEATQLWTLPYDR